MSRFATVFVLCLAASGCGGTQSTDPAAASDQSQDALRKKKKNSIRSPVKNQLRQMRLERSLRLLLSTTFCVNRDALWMLRRAPSLSPVLVRILRACGSTPT